MPKRETENNSLTRALAIATADSVEDVLEAVVRCIPESMHVARCVVWWFNKIRNGFSIRFSYGAGMVTRALTDAFVSYENARDLGLLDAEQASDVARDVSLRAPEFEGSLLARIHYDEQTNGLLAISRPQNETWSEDDRKLLKAIAAAASKACCHLDHLKKGTQLIEILNKLAEATYDDPVVDIALEHGKALLDCDRAAVRRLNLRSGELDLERSSPKVTEEFALPIGTGVTGLALQKRRAFRIADVTSPPWRDISRRLWPGSRSELAVPILLPRTRVRVGTKIYYVDKPFGVLTFESPGIAAFSSFHEQCVVPVTQHMARVFERIEFDGKLEKLRRIERRVASVRDWDSIVDAVMKEIRDTLGYEYVSLSVLDSESGTIRCSRVLGIEQAAEFRKAEVHDLKGNSIQADIVRTRQTEVPAPDDPRLGRELGDRFGLGRFIRVFMPILAPSHDEVLGTVSAGYDRKNRPNIYERDVQVLKGFVDFAGTALETWRRGVIDRVSHEMNAPLSAVRSNLSVLRRRRDLLTEERIDRALEDMATDAEILNYQVQQLEYAWGARVSSASKRALKIEPVLLFRDIIFKTITQLKPMVRDKGLDPSRVTYDMEEVYKVKTVHLDKSKISQVIFNLFVNAVKYSESPDTFQIRIGAEEQGDYYVIRFLDWGIGVPEGLEEKIFDEWFRAPSARESTVSGSGLGLTIARQLMREHGGDVVLNNRSKPTEFDIIIPKRPLEGP